MSTERDDTRIVRAWLEEGVTVLPDRVLDAVLDQLPATPQRRSIVTAWRHESMSILLRVGLAAAVLLGAAVLASNLIPRDSGPSIGSSPTPSALPATPSPSPVSSGTLPATGSIVQGTYLVNEPFPINMGLEFAPGWAIWGGAVDEQVLAVYEDSPDPPAGHGIVFVLVEDVYANACDGSQGLLGRDLGPSVQDLADALANQASTDSTEPKRVTIDGFEGLYLDYRSTGEDCSTVARWPSSQGNRLGLEGERDQVWILDVDGQRLVIDAFSFGETSDADLREMREMIEGLDLGAAGG